MENVYALTYKNRASAPAFSRLLDEIDGAGYSCSWRVLNAADFGVPQLRPRLFIVGAPKRSRLPELPEPTHGGRWERRTTGNDGLPHVTTGEALAGLLAPAEQEETVRGKWGHLLEEIPPGENYCTTRQKGVTRTQCSIGGVATGHFCSSLTQRDPPQRSKPSLAQTLGLSIGRTEGCECQSFVAFSHFLTTSNSWDVEHRCNPKLGIRSRRCWPSE